MRNYKLLFAIAATSTLLHADVVIYDNTSLDVISLSLSAAGIVEAGNQIQFGAGPRVLKRGAFSTYNEDSNAQTTYATLNLYNVSGNVLGSLIGSYTSTFSFAPGAGPNVEIIQFALPNVVVPNEIVWTLSFTNNFILLNYALPPGPTAGTLTSGAWWRNSGLGEQLTRRTPPEVSTFESYNSQFTAAPEPASVLLTAGALVIMAGGAFRQRRQ